MEVPPGQILSTIMRNVVLEGYKKYQRSDHTRQCYTQCTQYGIEDFYVEHWYTSSSGSAYVARYGCARACSALSLTSVSRLSIFSKRSTAKMENKQNNGDNKQTVQGTTQCRYSFHLGFVPSTSSDFT